MKLSDNARTVFDLRYSRKDEQGRPTETPEEAVDRIVAAVAASSLPYAPYLERVETYRHLLDERLFFPNSPTWTGAGTPLGQMSACFVIPVEDDLGRRRDSIFESLKVAALIQQTGGGNGFDFSRLRPENEVIRTSMGTSCGPCGFIRAYDAAFGIIQQGGSRRGANMGVLRVDHPDIKKFIALKVKEGEVSNFNLSVAVTDEFMDAVASDSDFALRWGGKVYETVRARDLFGVLTSAAWEIGDPGCLFIDRANRDNPCPVLYQYEATNPCVTGDTWVMTLDGPRRVTDLVGVPTRIVVNGFAYDSTGFFFTKETEVYEVRTRQGWRVKVTADHRILTPGGWVETSALAPGDEVVLNLHGDELSWKGEGSREDGYLLGFLWGDGTISAQNGAILSTWDHDQGSGAMRKAAYEALCWHPHRLDWRGWMKVSDRPEWRMLSRSLTRLAASFGMKHGDKHIGDLIEVASSDFYVGFLRGAFDTDGHVEGTWESGLSIRLSQSHLADLEAVQRMLGRLGVLSSIYHSERDDAGFGRGSQWRLVISGRMATRFMERVGFTNTAKSEKWYAAVGNSKRGFYKPTYTATVEEIVCVGSERTYDAQVSNVHAFDANGLYVHNCGEQYLPPYGSCTLGSIAVQRCLVSQRLGDRRHYSMDWDKLARVVRESVWFLDDVLDANKYVEHVPELREMAHNERRIGLGLMGVADTLALLGLRYGSEKAQEWLEEITCFCRYWAMRTSVDLAKERGPFTWFNQSIYAGQGGSWTPPAGCGLINDEAWRVLAADIAEYGIRNACIFNFAPTGTISTVADCAGSGLEPFFALVYERLVTQEARSIVLHVASPVFQQALLDVGLSTAEVDLLVERVSQNRGSLRGVSWDGISISPQDRSYIEEGFVVAADVSALEHVAMQGAAQTYTDNSISKTINLPHGATVEDVANVYQRAFDLGCKGITIYRQGSRVVEVLSTAPASVPASAGHAESSPAPIEGWPVVTPLPLPATAEQFGIASRVFPVRTAFGTLQVVITEHPDYPGRPFDVRLSVGKAGSDKYADVEAIGRSISTSTRSGVDLRDIVDQLVGIGGRSVNGFGPKRSLSVADAVGKLLQRLYLSEDYEDEEVLTLKGAETRTADSGLTCPLCHNATVVVEQGCKHCDVRIGGCGRYNACD